METEDIHDIDDAAGVSELSEKIANLKKLFRKLHKIISILSVLLMAIGGCVFCLGVLLRPFLRLVSKQHLWVASVSSDLLICGGIMQIVIAGLSCFATIWGFELAMYSCISLCTGLTVLELASLGMGFYIASQGKIFPTEHIFQAWYLWECKELGSCKAAYRSYINSYFIPQAVLTVVAIALQWATLTQMIRYVQGIKKIRALRFQAGELLHHPYSKEKDMEETNL